MPRLAELLRAMETLKLSMISVQQAMVAGQPTPFPPNRTPPQEIKV